MDNNYLVQRLAALGVNNASSGNNVQEVEALKAKVAQLEKQLDQVPQANFKSEAQVAFEQSPEFDNILNIFYMRFMRDKFGSEFRSSSYIQEFQAVANQAFVEFEKKFKTENNKKGGTKNAPIGQRTAGNGKTDNVETGE